MKKYILIVLVVVCSKVYANNVTEISVEKTKDYLAQLNHQKPQLEKTQATVKLAVKNKAIAKSFAKTKLTSKKQVTKEKLPAKKNLVNKIILDEKLKITESS